VGSKAPAGAIKTVHVYVSRLRKALGDPELIETTPDALERRICGAIPRNLTRAEWAQYLPDQAYHPTCNALTVK
jgi:hypothetical protein